MASERLYMHKVNSWDKMDTAVTINGVPNLEVILPKLRTKSQQIRSLYAQHAAHAAARQVITQEMEQLIEEGEQIYRSLREGLKEYYGKRNEKLVEFGVEPLRGRTRKPVPPPAPEAPASTPDSVK